MSGAITWRTIWRQIQNLDVEKKFRRQSPRRKLIAAVSLVIFLIYLFSGGKKSSANSRQDQIGVCTQEKLKFYQSQIDDFDMGLNEDAIKFVGNGFFGMDPNGELVLGSFLKQSSGLFPGLNIEIDGVTGIEEEEAVLTDFRNGVLKIFKCFSLENSECGCVVNSIYAHRIRKEVMVQEILISNPTKSTIRLNLNRQSSNWWANSKIGDITTHQRNIANSSYVVVCSDPPGKISVSQKREETLKFHCVITNSAQKLEAVQIFKETKDAYSKLDTEHFDAWNLENSEVSFSIQTSKAPNVLNGDRINGTRYLLQSHLPTSTSQLPPPANCYNGHSTLLYPSRLWLPGPSQNYPRPLPTPTLSQLVENWKLTLEKQGCASLLASSQGITQAFVQSLGAASYNQGHLEFALNSDDLHREMRIKGLPLGQNGPPIGRVTVEVRLDAENRPEFYVKTEFGQLFACDGGCLDQPVVLTQKSLQKIPVKVTKPVTSLLYVATNRKHLEQLKSAIHVSEVQTAPAHLDDVIELHKNGDTSSGSLPTSFWILLILTLIAFHAILAKLFWNEWRKGDMTPYNPYLRNRYSQRPH